MPSVLKTDAISRLFDNAAVDATSASEKAGFVQSVWDTAEHKQR